jgi:ATP-binding cassette, subfamily B, multidrug efflux pump
VTSLALQQDEQGFQGTADLTLVRRLLGYLRRQRRLWVLALVLYPIDALSVIVPPYLVQQILDRALPQRSMSLLLALCGVYVLSLLVEYAAGFASLMAMSVLGQRAMRELRSDLFDHVQRLPASFFDRNPIGRTLTRLTTDVEALSDVFATGSITIVADAITVVGVVSMMVWLDVELTLMSFVVVPPLVVLAAVIQRLARRAFRAIRMYIARINAYLAEHITGMSVVQVFRQQARTRAEFAQLSEDSRDAHRDSIRYDALLFSSVEAIGTFAVAALIWYGAVDLATGAVGAGTLVAFIQYIRRFFVPIRDLSTKYTVLQSAFASAERIFHLLDERVTITTTSGARHVERLEQRLALEGVWFAYREPVSDAAWVLRGLDLEVRRGERVALVGATGSGKTTVLKLLSRFYEATRGRVTVDGVDVRELDLASLRRLFAVVLQDVHLFSGTIHENLSLGAQVTPEQVRAAARAVRADDFIARLPRGYDTLVAEGGVNFSAGEKQLLAFARALTLDPQVLVLDEATSNVDTETEAQIERALDVVLAGRTAIVVAHRLSTVRKVDRICVLQRGRVVEQGDHAALMRRDGLYRRLVELQFENRSAGDPP